jgi:hypothetical protein
VYTTAREQKNRNRQSTKGNRQGIVSSDRLDAAEPNAKNRYRQKKFSYAHTSITPEHQTINTPPYTHISMQNTTEHQKIHTQKVADNYGQMSQPKGLKKEVKKTTKKKPLQL